MPLPAAEALFRKGLVSLHEDRPQEAARHFRAAMLLERGHNVQRQQMRYLSYYGLSIARAERPTPEAIRACETAVDRDSFNPDLYLNLGRVYLMAGKQTKALAAFERGLSIAPDHPELQVQLQITDRRKPPPLSFLSRKHPMNRWLGKVRGRMTGQA